jgi:hypothetical protein
MLQHHSRRQRQYESKHSTHTCLRQATSLRRRASPISIHFSPLSIVAKETSVLQSAITPVWHGHRRAFWGYLWGWQDTLRGMPPSTSYVSPTSAAAEPACCTPPRCHANTDASYGTGRSRNGNAVTDATPSASRVTPFVTPVNAPSATTE